MAGVNGNRKGKKDDNGIGTAIDFMLSNAKLVLGVGGAAMLGIATLAVKRVRALHRPFILSCFLFLHNVMDAVLLHRCTTVPSVLPPAPLRWSKVERKVGRSQCGWVPPHGC